MSVLNTLPATVVQMGLVEKIADQQQNQPHALLQASQEASRELLNAERQRIAKSEAMEHGRKVRDRGDDRPGERKDRRNSQGNAPSTDNKTATGQLDEELSGGGAEAPVANPWAGNIVNMKI